MGAKVTLKNWDVAGKMFNFTIPETLIQEVDSAVQQANEIYSNSILEVLAEQPGDWTPKSESWKESSGSADLYYGKTGQFVMAVTDTNSNTRGIKAKRGDKRIFVGARHDLSHHSGMTIESLAILLASKYGERELFGRAYERVEDQIHAVFKSVGSTLR